MTTYTDHGAEFTRTIHAGDEIKASANYYECVFHVERGAKISEFAGFHNCQFTLQGEPVTREELLHRLEKQEA